MSAVADRLFFTQAEMDPSRVQGLVDDTLAGADDGELFLEYRESEGFSFDDGRLKAATFDSAQGFGLRCVAGESTGYAHATEVAAEAHATGKGVAEIVLAKGLMSKERLDEVLRPEVLTCPQELEPIHPVTA